MSPMTGSKPQGKSFVLEIPILNSARNRADSDVHSWLYINYPFASKLWQSLVRLFPRDEQSVAEDLIYDLFVADHEYANSNDPVIKQSSRELILDNFYKLQQLVDENERGKFKISYNKASHAFSLAILVDQRIFNSDDSLLLKDGSSTDCLNEPAEELNFLSSLKFRPFESEEVNSTWENIENYFNGEDRSKAEKIFAEMSLRNSLAGNLQGYSKLLKLASDSQVFVSRTAEFGLFKEARCWSQINTCFSEANKSKAEKIFVEMSFKNSFADRLQNYLTLLNMATENGGRNAFVSGMREFPLFDQTNGNLILPQLIDHFDTENVAEAMKVINTLCSNVNFEKKLEAFSALTKLAKFDSQTKFKIEVKHITSQVSRYESTDKINLTIKIGEISIEGRAFNLAQADDLLTKYVYADRLIDTTSKNTDTSNARKLVTKHNLASVIAEEERPPLEKLLTDLSPNSDKVYDNIRIFTSLVTPSTKHLFKVELAKSDKTGKAVFNFKIKDLTVASLESSMGFSDVFQGFLTTFTTGSREDFIDSTNNNNGISFYTNDQGKTKLHIDKDLEIDLPDNAIEQLMRNVMEQYISHARSNPEDSIDPKNIELENLDFSGMDFRYLNLTGIKFKNCNLAGADFTGSNLADAGFHQSILTNTKFNESTLSFTNFVGSILDKASFDGAVDFDPRMSTHVNDDD